MLSGDETPLWPGLLLAVSDGRLNQEVSVVQNTLFVKDARTENQRIPSVSVSRFNSEWNRYHHV